MANRFGKDKPKDDRTRNWTILVYEDSAPANWRDVIANLHVPAYISPYHDRDKRANGEDKKPHWHVVLCFRGKKSVQQIQAISDQLSGVHVDWEHCAVGDLSGMVRYLVHFDDGDKAQYEISDIQALSGADVLAHFAGAADVDATVGEMMDWLVEQGITSFAALARFARKEKPEWFRILTSKRTVFMTQYCRSLQWEIDQGLDPFGQKDECAKCDWCDKPAVGWSVGPCGTVNWCAEHEVLGREYSDSLPDNGE